MRRQNTTSATTKIRVLLLSGQNHIVSVCESEEAAKRLSKALCSFVRQTDRSGSRCQLTTRESNAAGRRPCA